MTEDVISRFLGYLKFEKRYASHTLTAYQNDLDQFQAYLQATYDQSDITLATTQQVRSWLASLLKEKLSTRSINRKISALKACYKFLSKTDKLAKNPMEKITPPKSDKKLPVFITKEALNRLFDQPDAYFNKNETKYAQRDHLLILLFYTTGMRISELIHLPILNIDIHKSQIKVLGKRNKERIIPITEECAIHLTTYLSSVPSEQYFLFQNAEGKALNPRSVYQLVRNYISKISTVNKRSPHVLRHSYATHLLNEGAELNGIKELLGHTNLAATQVYTHNSIDRLKEVYKNKHPRA